MSHDDQHPQHRHTFQQLDMKLQFEMQGLLLHTTTLVQEWQRLHGCNEVVGNEVSTLAGHILLTGFVRLQRERESWYQSCEQDDLAQKERRIQQDMLNCSMEIATCKAKLIRLDYALALL